MEQEVTLSNPCSSPSLASSKPLEFQFLDHIIERFFRLMHVRQENNYDALRFSQDGVDRSNAFNLDWHMANLYNLFSDYKSLYKSYALLEDQVSRDLFIEKILFCLAGSLHVKLTRNNNSYWATINALPKIPSVPSRFSLFATSHGELRHYERVCFNGQYVSIDCWPQDIAWGFILKQYFFERDNRRIQPEPGDYAIDAGACLGNTSLAFAIAVGETGQVYAFDPVGAHNEIILYNLVQNPNLANRITVFPYALANRGNTLPGPLSTGDIADAGFSLDKAENPNQLPIRRIDDLVEQGHIMRVDFLKMDIEGSELDALRGAEKSIRRFKPRLAICIYHKFSDLYEIPQFITNLRLGYKLFIDHYSIHSEETVLYATVD